VASSHKDAFSDARSRLAQARASGSPAAVKRALRELEHARHALCPEAEKAAHALIVALEDQNRLSERVMSGLVPPEEANRTNRHLSTRISGIRSRIAELNALLASEKPVEAARSPKFSAPFWATSKGVPAPLPGRSLLPSRRGFIVWLICMILGVVIPLIHFGIIRFGAPVRISFAERADAPGGYRVTVENRGRAIFHVLVPGLGSGASDPPRGGPVYGLKAQLIETGNDSFRGLPDEVALWSYMGAPLVEPVEVSVMPGAGVEFGFMLPAPRGPSDPQGIRFVLLGRDGTILASTRS